MGRVHAYAGDRCELRVHDHTSICTIAFLSISIHFKVETYMSDDSKEFMRWVDALAKGILAGAAVGYLLSLTDLMPPAKAVVLGGLAGSLASITFKNRQDDKKKRATKKGRINSLPFFWFIPTEV